MGAIAQFASQAAAAPAAPTPSAAGGGGGPFGFIGNIIGDVKDLGLGLGSIVSSGLHDLGRAVGQAIPGGQDWGVISDNPEDQYRLDNIVTALPGAIIGDYANRYGSGSKIASGLYEHPLSYLLDALAVGAVAGTGAKIAGSAAVKASEAASAARAFSGVELGGEAARIAGVTEKAANLAGISKGLEALEATRPLTPMEALAKALLPKQTVKLVGKDAALEFVPSIQAANPMTRALLSPIRKLSTRPVGALEADLGKVQAQIAESIASGEPASAALRAQEQILGQLVRDATDAGLTRIQRPSVSAATAEVQARRWFAKTKGAEFSAKLKERRVYESLVTPFMKADPTLEQTGSAYITGLHVEVPGFERSPWLEQQVAAVERTRLPVTVGGGSTSPALTLSLDEGVLQAAADVLPDIAQRTEAVATRLRDYIKRMNDNPQLADVGGLDVAAETDAANRLMSSLYERLARRVKIERGELVTPAGKHLTDVLDLQDMEKMVDEFDALANTPSHVLEAKYRPLRIAHGATQSADTIAPEGGPSVQALDDAFRAADEPAPTYFAFMRPAEMKPSDFFTSKQKIGANIYARDPHTKPNYGTLLRSGEYERNPMEVFVRRAARSSRAQQTYRLWSDMVRNFGRPIASSDDLPPGFEVVSPDLLFLHHGSGAKYGDMVDDLMASGKSFDEAAAQALKEVGEANLEKIRALQESGQVQMWAVPKVVTDRLNDASRYAGFLGGKGRLSFDSVMAGWRGLVLSGSPRWVLNNFLGNTVFGALQGVKVADVVKLLGANFKEMLGGESKILTELRKLPGFEDVGQTGFVGSSTSMYEPLKPALKGSMLGRLTLAAGETRPMSWARRYGQGMRSLNGVVEDSFREASYLSAIEQQAGRSAITRTGRSFLSSESRVGKIMADGFTESQARAALERVNHFFGDYSALGPFERHVIRRWLVPFWGFYKHQGKLLLTFPFESPLRAQVLNGFAAVNRDMMAQYGPMPEWLQGAVPFGPPGQGEIPFFSSVGPNPFNASFQDPTSMLSPLLKIAWERAKGENVFTGQPFSDPNVIRPYGSEQAFQIQRDEQGNVVGVTPLEGQPLPGIGWHLLQQIPQFGMIAQAIAGGKSYDTAPFQALVDPETGQPRYPTNILAQALKLGGLGTTPYDLGSYQERLAELQKAALTAAQRQG